MKGCGLHENSVPIFVQNPSAIFLFIEDLSLVLDKTVKLDWLKSNNSRTRVLRITQKEEKIVRKTLQVITGGGRKGNDVECICMSH